MSVALRRKRLKDGRISLYLDIYDRGRRQFEWLDFKLIGNRDTDKPMLQIAEKIRAEKELELASFKYDFAPLKQNVSFYDYADKIIATKNVGNQKLFHSFMQQFKEFAGVKITFFHLTPSFCSDFYSYLLAQKLNPNTASVYFVKLKELVNCAIRDGIITSNPTKGVKLKHTERRLKYLTLQEVQKLVATPCRNVVVRQSFLFGCCTGLRISDMHRLKWSHLNQGRIELYQQKTKRLVVVPLNKTALSILAELPTDSEFVFQFPTDVTVNHTLKCWAKDAGLDKSISFHWSRHTFATMALSAGVDIYVVSKLLGHTNIGTTTIYANVLDYRKEDAVKMLPDLRV